MFDAGAVVQTATGSLESGNWMVSSDIRLHLRKNYAWHVSSIQLTAWKWRLTAHGCVDAPNIHQEREHGEIRSKDRRFAEPLFESVGRLGGVHDGFYI